MISFQDAVNAVVDDLVANMPVDGGKVEIDCEDVEARLASLRGDMDRASLIRLADDVFGKLQSHRRFYGAVGRHGVFIHGGRIISLTAIFEPA